MLTRLVSAVDQSPEILEKVRSFWRERLGAGTTLVATAMEKGELPPDTNVDLLVEGLLTPIYLPVLLPANSVTREFLDQVIDLLVSGVRHGAVSSESAGASETPRCVTSLGRVRGQ
jgi:hypothetical protein